MEGINVKDRLLCVTKNMKSDKFLISISQYNAQNADFKDENKEDFSQVSNNLRIANVCQQIFYQIYENCGLTQLHLACILRNRDTIAAIICETKQSELLDVQNVMGHTALHLAVLSEQVNVIFMLLLAGADPNLRDHNGNTALHLACMTNNVGSVRALITPIEEIKKKFTSFKNTSHIVPTDLEIRNYSGQRCIHLVAQAGNLSILPILINSGADINAQEGKAGRTALHIAIEMNNDKMFTFILSEYLSSLNLMTATYAGCTIYEAALTFNKSEFYNFLKTCAPHF